MDVTIAYFHALLHSEVVKQDFEKIRSAGANSIVYAIQEQEEQRGPRDLERGLRQARDAGLRVNLSLGRFGNLFAGPALVPSWYTFRHPQSRVMDQHGRYHEISCFNHQSFRSWLFREIEHYLTTYPISGLVLEEPRGLEVTCYCSACRALCPDVTDLARFRRRSMIEFLHEICVYVKELNTRIKTIIVLHPYDISLAEDLASIEQLDTLGSHLFWDILQENVTRVEQWGRQLLEVARAGGKRSQLWLQNFNINERNAAAMEAAFAAILGLEPDEMGCYYFWRNNADPEQVWDSTRKMLKRVPRRQLYWRLYASPSPRPMNLTLPSRARPGNEPVVMLTATLAEAASVEEAPGAEPAAPLSPADSEEVSQPMEGLPENAPEPPGSDDGKRAGPDESASVEQSEEPGPENESGQG